MESRPWRTRRLSSGKLGRPSTARFRPIGDSSASRSGRRPGGARDETWGARFPVITQAWRNAWEYVTPFLTFPPELLRVVYTTNAAEALNPAAAQSDQDERTVPQRGVARKLIYLAIVNAVRAWTRTCNWTTALLAFKIHLGDRLAE
jgi:transposase-like protein